MTRKPYVRKIRLYWRFVTWDWYASYYGPCFDWSEI